MLLNLKELMQYAEARDMAIGAFNGPTLESARCIESSTEAWYAADSAACAGA